MASNNRNKNKWWFYPKVLKTKKSHPLNLIRLLQMIFIVPYISSLYPFNFKLSNVLVRVSGQSVIADAIMGVGLSSGYLFYE